MIHGAIIMSPLTTPSVGLIVDPIGCDILWVCVRFDPWGVEYKGPQRYGIKNLVENCLYKVVLIPEEWK